MTFTISSVRLTTATRRSCELLLEAGADKEAKTKDGKTALYWARRSNYASIVALLDAWRIRSRRIRRRSRGPRRAPPPPVVNGMRTNLDERSQHVRNAAFDREQTSDGQPTKVQAYQLTAGARDIPSS